MLHGHQQQGSDDADRTNRFLGSTTNGNMSPSGLRSRAASQPPRTGEGQNFLPSPEPQHHIPSNSAAAPWPAQRSSSGGFRGGQPMSVPNAQRSASFSTSPQANLYNAMRDSRVFLSTFEDDESEALSESYDDQFIPPSLTRGRTSNIDVSRSRSQSLAPTRAMGGNTWGDLSMSSANPLNIPSSRYGDIKPPGSSRYGSLGAFGHSPNSPGGGLAAPRQNAEISNISPFMRDVGQILLDDGSAFRELWSGMNPPRDENGGGGSGTTSRRHSVSVVQPRRGPQIIGFSAPGQDGPDEPVGSYRSPTGFNPSGLGVTDDDLAFDLGMLNLGTRDAQRRATGLNVNIPGGSGQLGSAGESGRSGNSPSRHYDDQSGLQSQGQQLAARYIPGQGIQYFQQGPLGPIAVNRGPSVPAPHMSPTSARSPHHPQQQQQQHLYGTNPRPRAPSDASAGHHSGFQDLGRGVPLHSVPASWPLYIVEFKAGRTDLFYTTDPNLNVRTGDLVIVEADRGKDLGKVVNDSITIAEVEAFQRQQAAANAAYDEPMSPGGSGTASKKEINPKMIYGKAQPHDTQLLVTKIQDEMKALQLCQQKVRQKNLPMEVVDAEYQWDRRKLTFYFVAEKRIDFRELVRELFRLYKTRIWMASLQGSASYEQ